MLGWNASTQDTLGVSVVPTSGGAPVMWTQMFAETGGSRWSSDGSVTLLAWSGTDAVTVHRISGPGERTVVGQVARPVTTMTISADGTRATVMSREARGDAWRYTVVKP
jgi:hypothetical protein